MSEPFQKSVVMRLAGGTEILCNVQLASVPKVGPGGPPHGPWLVRPVDGGILTIDVEFREAKGDPTRSDHAHAAPGKLAHAGTEVDPQEQEMVVVPLQNQEGVFCRFSVASTVVVGLGPRPKGPVALVHCIDGERFLVIETRIGPTATANIKAGPGAPP